MAKHADAAHYEIVTDAPVSSPGAGELRQKLQKWNNGCYKWVWSDTENAWEGGNYRPGESIGSPNGFLTPLFVNQEVTDTLNGRKYYASTLSNTSWIDYGYGGGGSS